MSCLSMGPSKTSVSRNGSLRKQLQITLLMMILVVSSCEAQEKATAVECSEWEVYRDHRGHEPVLKENKTNVEECKEACIDDPDCYAVDFNRRRELQTRCWLFYEKKFVPMHLVIGIDHYELDRNCHDKRECSIFSPSFHISYSFSFLGRGVCVAISLIIPLKKGIMIMFFTPSLGLSVCLSVCHASY